MLRIVCMKWGDAYTEEDVFALQDSIKCSVPYTFECFTEDLETFTEYHEKYFRGHGAPSEPREIWHNGYHRDDFGGIPHHRKLQLFKLDEKFDPEDKILYLDLDSIIHRDLAYFYNLDTSQKPYIVKNYWWQENDEWKN